MFNGAFSSNAANTYGATNPSRLAVKTMTPRFSFWCSSIKLHRSRLFDAPGCTMCVTSTSHKPIKSSANPMSSSHASTNTLTGASLPTRNGSVKQFLSAAVHCGEVHTHGVGQQHTRTPGWLAYLGVSAAPPNHTSLGAGHHNARAVHQRQLNIRVLLREQVHVLQFAALDDQELEAANQLIRFRNRAARNVLKFLNELQK